MLRDRLSVRRLRRQVDFTDGLVHEVVVPPGPDGRPGERLLAPSRSFYAPSVTSDDSRSDFCVLVARGGSNLRAVCFGRDAERGALDEFAASTIDKMQADGFNPSRLPSEEIAGHIAVTYRVSLNRRPLIEWKFAHDGWLYGAGLVCLPLDSEQHAVDRARAVLATWRWH